MNLLQIVMNDLRERRLWPVAVALALALVAVPVALSRAGSPTSSAPPAPSEPAPTVAGLPAVSVKQGATPHQLTGSPRDPFLQPAPAWASAPKTTTTVTSTSSASGKSGTSAAGSSPSSASASGSGGASTPSTSGTPSTSPSGGPSGHPVPFPRPNHGRPPGTLSPTQSYAVSLSVTNAAGGVDTVDPLQRLSPVPSQDQPQLIELGVLKGGGRVLFVVQPGTGLSGPGVCTPAPTDCEILSLAAGEVESITVPQSDGSVQNVMFSATSIYAQNHPSAAAAARARRAVNPVGARLLSHSSYDSLALFPYDAGQGVILDQRDLTVGGN